MPTTGVGQGLKKYSQMWYKNYCSTSNADDWRMIDGSVKDDGLDVAVDIQVVQHAEMVHILERLVVDLLFLLALPPQTPDETA